MWSLTTLARRIGDGVMTVVGWAVFSLAQIVWLPVSIIAGVVVGSRQVNGSKERGVSLTAIEVLYGRFAMHIFGLRDDPASVALVKALPTTSYLAYWLAMFPLWLSWKLTGTHILYPTLPAPEDATPVGLIISRTPVFDDLITRHLDDVSQVVVLGAGMDTRAYGMLRDSSISIFELDQGPTQQLKREALESAGIEADHVTFVPVDFERSDWPEALMATSYKPRAKTLFVWEGVTLYLSASNISLTLRLLGSHSGTGSVVVADLYSRRYLASINRTGRRILSATGEDLRFGLDLSSQQDLAVKAFLTSCEVDTSEVQLLGSHHPKGAFMAVAAMNLPS